ncbi:MAG: hypothetical protein FWE13_04755 [Firmicutes bacterium]|nr:hypothetical protein [Bacillota bacterium]
MKKFIIFALVAVVAISSLFVFGCSTNEYQSVGGNPVWASLIGSWQHENNREETHVFDADGTLRIYVEDFRYLGTLFRGGLMAIVEWSINDDFFTVFNREASEDHPDKSSTAQVIDITATRKVVRSQMPEILGGGYVDCVWVRVADRRDIDFNVGFIECKVREQGDLSTIVRSMEELKEIDSTFGRQLANLYTQEFFEQNALVVYLWTDIVTGSYFQVFRLSQIGNELIVNAYFKAGHARALSNWTVALEVSQANVRDITIVRIEKSDAICISIFYRY